MRAVPCSQGRTSGLRETSTPASDAWKKKHGKGKLKKNKGWVVDLQSWRTAPLLRLPGPRGAERDGCGEQGSASSAPPSGAEIPAKWEGLEKIKIDPISSCECAFQESQAFAEGDK